MSSNGLLGFLRGCRSLPRPLLVALTYAILAAPWTVSPPTSGAREILPTPHMRSTPNQGPGPESNNPMAYPPGTTGWILQYALSFTGGLLFLYLLNALVNHRADRAADASLAKEARELRQLKIGYPEGMTFLEELRKRQLLESRLGSLGVTLIWKSFPSASILLSGLSNGEVDFCGGGGTASVFSQAAGHLFVRVAREKYPDLQGEAILVPQDSPIQSLPDLRGKTIAFDEGSSAQYVLIRALQNVGLHYQDIHPLLLSQAEALPGFQSGEADAWVVWMPYAPTEARRRYPGRSIADLHGILGESAASEVPTLYYSTPELVRDFPRILKAVLEEVNEAGVEHNQSQLEAAEARAGSGTASEPIEPELMQSLRQRSLERTILPLDEPTLRSLQDQANVLHDLRLVPERVNVYDGTYSLRTRQNWTY